MKKAHGDQREKRSSKTQQIRKVSTMQYVELSKIYKKILKISILNVILPIVIGVSMGILHPFSGNNLGIYRGILF